MSVEYTISEQNTNSGVIRKINIRGTNPNLFYSFTLEVAEQVKDALAKAIGELKTLELEK